MKPSYDKDNSTKLSNWLKRNRYVYYYFFILFVAIIAGRINFLIPEDSFQTESIYWLFSSSSQTIAAFFGLLLAGYAISLTVMSDHEERDETLEEIHHELKTEYYNRISRISITTAISILLSLAMLLINGNKGFPFKLEMGLTTTIMVALSIVWGVAFVLEIVDPNRYRKIARKLLKNKGPAPKAIKNKVSAAIFFELFVECEGLLRNYFDNVITPAISMLPKRFLQFKDLIRMMGLAEIGDNHMRQELLEISKVRNLVFHGQLKEVDQDLILRLKEIMDKIKATLDERKNKA